MAASKGGQGGEGIRWRTGEWNSVIRWLLSATASAGVLVSAGAWAAPAFSVLHTFAIADGGWPYDFLTEVDGALYGTTTAYGANNGGTVFKIAPDTGAYKVLHAFPAYSGDGNNPGGAVIDLNGILYGTTQFGGTNNGGTVFSLNPKSGKEKVLHSFGVQGAADGFWPAAVLTKLNGLLYSVTMEGGGAGQCKTGHGNVGCGTVFSINPKTGAEKIVYAFRYGDDPNDGAAPVNGLINVDGKLYGTTQEGGNGPCASLGEEGPAGCGTIFSIDPKTGEEHVLHALQGGADGQDPAVDLVEVGGLLYGAAGYGGNVDACKPNGLADGCGLVFSFNPANGKYKVIYRFHGPDGNIPTGLTYSNGKLWIATYYGSPNKFDGGVFTLRLSDRHERVIHAFVDAEGTYPVNRLTKLNGAFYGMTFAGSSQNIGTIYQITP